MKEIVKISVRAMVEWALRSGDLGFGYAGPDRRSDAVKAHQKLQGARPENYAKEGQVKRSIESDDFILEITGRIDGVFKHETRPVIEEIKSTLNDPKVETSAENPLHWGQAKAYALMYALENDSREMEVRLTYVHLDTEETSESSKVFAMDELEEFFAKITGRYMVWVGKRIKWRKVRDEANHALRFPYSEFRPGQWNMAAEVFRTIRDNGQLLVEAPTGVGKTIAALFPAVKAQSESLTGKIFLLTARTTGRVAADKAIDEMRTAGARIKSLNLTAKDKVCLNLDATCHPDDCPFAKGYFDRIGPAMDEAESIQDFGRECIEQLAKKHHLCPFELSLDISITADVIVADYNYAFDPAVYLKRFFDTGRDFTFLVDEAHNLVDRSRYMFSAAINKKHVLDVRRQVKTDSPDLYEILGRINQWLLETRKACETKGGRIAEESMPEDFIEILPELLETAWPFIMENRKLAYREELVDLCVKSAALLRTADWFDENYVTGYEVSGSDLEVSLICLNQAECLARTLKRCRSAIFFSATLSPYEFYHRLFGLTVDATGLRLESPFPKENLSLLIGDGISTRYRDREATKEKVAAIINALASHRPGNYLAFFPSYAYMESVLDIFSTDDSDVEILVQSPNMSESERDAFLARFKSENDKTLLGFAVMGGIFGEGIDLVGDRLSGAVVVGVGLPGIDWKRDLIREHFDNQSGAGFEYAYLYPGIRRVMQAAGRVIRSETDRGVVLLIDDRFNSPRYRALFPSNWQSVRIKNENDLIRSLSN